MSSKGEIESFFVAPTAVGLGIFTRLAFEVGDVVCLLPGEVIDDPDYSSDYCMDMGGRFTLEPAAPFRYLNHACAPNCEIVQYDDKTGAPDPLYLEAVAPIAPGEQLTIDYAWPAENAIPCLCGAGACRGWIVDPAELHLVGPRAARREVSRNGSVKW